MYNLLISLGAMSVVTLIFGQWLDKLAYGLIPGLIVGIGVFIVLGRRVLADLQARMAKVQELMTPKNPQRPPSKQQAQKMIDEAVEILKGGLEWQKWQFLVESQIAGQIGMLYFMGERRKDAVEWLEKSTARNWSAKVMLGSIHYRAKRDEEMVSVFEEAARHAGKESLFWNTYAWCLWKRGKSDEAIKVLYRGKEATPNDERTQRNIKSLENGKAMKMHGWGQMWYQFQLERPNMQQMAQMHGARRQAVRGR